MIADYETLKLVWWVLVGVLLIGFAITDGFDMGVGALLPWLGRTDNERRVMINSVGPHWDGNQVWFITAGGALFAAWPMVYATAFSGLYTALIITLLALYLRPVGFDYRSKLDNPAWRQRWDWALFVGSSIPPIIFGVAFGNLFLGLPFDMDAYLRSHYDGGLFGLLRPFPLLCGVLSLSMLVMHGGVWLGMKTEGDLRKRANKTTVIAAVVTSILFGIGGAWIAYGINGMTILSMGDPNGVVSPLSKTVQLNVGGWLQNFAHYPILAAVPLLGLGMPFITAIFVSRQREGLGFVTSSLAVASIIGTAGLALFPFVMPSSLNPDHSLTMWDATSSAHTLSVMLIVACVFVPIVLGYTIWSYAKMWGRMSTQHIEENSHSLY